MTPAATVDCESYGELASRLKDEAGDVVWHEYRTCFERALESSRQRLREPLTREEHEVHVALAQGSELSLAVLESVRATLKSR